MAGPTTEVLNEDMKALRDDLQRVELDLRGKIVRSENALRADINRLEMTFQADINRLEMTFQADNNRLEISLRSDINRLDVSLVEIKTTLNNAIKVATWGMTLFAGTLITSAVTGVWWASKINTKVESLEASVSKIADQAKPAAR
jgi:hypothetical protein